MPIDFEMSHLRHLIKPAEGSGLRSETEVAALTESG